MGGGRVRGVLHSGAPCLGGQGVGLSGTEPRWVPVW